MASASSEEAPGWFGTAPGCLGAAPGLPTALLRASEAATTLLLTVLPALVSIGTVLAGTISIPPVGLAAASKAGLLTYDIVTRSDCGVAAVEDFSDFSAEELVAAAAAGCSGIGFCKGAGLLRACPVTVAAAQMADCFLSTVMGRGEAAALSAACLGGVVTTALSAASVAAGPSAALS